MIVFSLATMLVAFALVWRGSDVRLVLMAAMLTIGVLAGQPGAVCRKAVEALVEPKYLLPMCSAMGFAFVARETGCAEAMVRLLVRLVPRPERLVLPGGAANAFVVNIAIPGQTAALAAVGPLLIPLMARVRTGAASAGSALVFGASVCGALMNPALTEIVVTATMVNMSPAALVVFLAPAAVAAFTVGVGALLFRLQLRARTGAPDRALPEAEAQRDGQVPSMYKAVFPALPILWLLLGHPSLPTHRLVQGLMPQGLEVFTAMLAGTALTVALASRVGEIGKSARSFFEGMGYAFANVATVLAVAAGVAKALEVAGVLELFVGLAAGKPLLTYAITFSFAFLLGLVSGSGTAPSIALLASVGSHAVDLGVGPLGLGGVILFGAEAGRTASPAAPVLVFGSTLVSVQPRSLSWRLLAPALVAGATGACICAVRGG